MVLRLMSIAVLVAMASAIVTAASLPSLGVASAIVAPAALATGMFVPSFAFDRFAKLMRPILIAILAAPALCMIVQVLPIPIENWGNPIWPMASAALNEPLVARLTVDIGATLLALNQYTAVITTTLIAAVITLDRQRAAHFLYILLAIATCESAFSLLAWSGYLLSEPLPAAVNNPIAAVLGVLLACTAALREIDKLRHHRQPLRFSTCLRGALPIAILCCFICTATLSVRGDFTVLAAALLGVEVLLVVVTVRNWFFGIWGTTGVLATAAMVFIACFSVVPIETNTDLTIALSTRNQSATERMLQDVGPGGSGAGAFNSLLPIYREIGNGSSRERPTDAAAVAIDMGRSFLCGLLIVVVLGACTLVKRSLSRRQDYVYAALGAGASVSLAVAAFSVDGLFDLSTSLLVAGLYGLAFGQSLPAAAREVTSWEPQEHPMETKDDRQWARLGLPLPSGRTWGRVGLISFGLVLFAQVAWILLNHQYSNEGLSVRLGPVLAKALSKTTSFALAREQSSPMGVPSASHLKADDAPLLSPPDHDLPSGPRRFAATLRHSPLRGDLWLLLAAMSAQNDRSGYDTAGLLKMSYYTAPNDVDLFPLRLSVALSRDALVRNLELRDLVSRELRVVVTRQPALKPALIAAYRSASDDGKAFAENLMSEFDRDYFQNMRGLPPALGAR